MLQVCAADVCINVARKVTKLKVKTSTIPLALMQVTIRPVLVQVTMQTRKTFLGDKRNIKICATLHAQGLLHQQSGAFISASNFHNSRGDEQVTDMLENVATQLLQPGNLCLYSIVH